MIRNRKFRVELFISESPWKHHTNFTNKSSAIMKLTRTQSNTMEIIRLTGVAKLKLHSKELI